MTVSTATRRATRSASPASVTTGLHGHRIGADTVRAAMAEGVGTFMLVLTIIGTTIAATLAVPVAGVPYGSGPAPLHRHLPRLHRRVLPHRPDPILSLGIRRRPHARRPRGLPAGVPAMR
jgi:hypothetical protein